MRGGRLLAPLEEAAWLWRRVLGRRRRGCRRRARLRARVVGVGGGFDLARGGRVLRARAWVVGFGGGRGRLGRRPEDLGEERGGRGCISRGGGLVDLGCRRQIRIARVGQRGLGRRRREFRGR